MKSREGGASLLHTTPSTKHGHCRRLLPALFLLLVFVLCLAVYSLNNPTGQGTQSLRRRNPQDAISLPPVTPTAWARCEPPRDWDGDSAVEQRLPRAVIAGIRKGGTRALLNMFRLHPCVKAVRREVHFFDRNKTWTKGLQWYRSQFPKTIGYEVGVEKSPAYFVTPEVPSRVKASLPDVKIVVLLRNPVERLISDFMQLMSKGESVDAINVGNLTKTELQRLEDKFTRAHFVTGEDGELTVRKDYYSVRLGLYHVFLNRWWSLFPKDRVRVVCSERFVRNPASVMQELSDFIGLPQSGFQWQDQMQFSKRKGFFCPKKRHRPNCLGSSKGRPHIRPPPEQMKKLYDFYTPHNDILFEMLGKKCFWTNRGRGYTKQTADPDTVSRILEQ